MSNLSRLTAFLSGAGRLEVVAPKDPASRPDHFVRFARLIGGSALVVSHALAPAPAAAEHIGSPVISDVDQASFASDPAGARAAVEQLKKISDRYLGHGHAGLRMNIRVYDGQAEGDEGPLTSSEGDDCRIDRLRTDYSHATLPAIVAMTDTPEMRALVLVHEHMHCRSGPAMMALASGPLSPEGARLVQIVNESAADAMGVLMLARRDGAPVALVALDKVARLRETEAASPEASGFHDTRETLKRVRELLTDRPEQVTSDGKAFMIALTESFAGGFQTLRAQLSPVERELLASPGFARDLVRFKEMIERAGNDYLQGKYQAGTVAISTNTWAYGRDGSGVAAPLLSSGVDLTPTGFSVDELAAAAGRIATTIVAQAEAEMPSRTIAAAAPAKSAFGAAGRIKAIYAGALSQAPAPAAVPEHDEVDQVGEEPSGAPAP